MYSAIYTLHLKFFVCTFHLKKNKQIMNVFEIILFHEETSIDTAL